MKIRGYLALFILCVGFLLCDLYQRVIITLLVRLRPHRRHDILGRWINFMATFVVGSVTRVGGASVPRPPRIVPSGPGVLVVMNHQSVLDIPLMVQTVDGGYPRIVTRARYRRFIPLISHMVRLYQYPVVDPTGGPRQLVGSLKSMGAAAGTSQVPIGIFPEGTRSRDGELKELRTLGLKRLLKERDWIVYVFVADGLWKTSKFKDFFGGMGHVDVGMVHAGTLRWSDPGSDPDAFIGEIGALMRRGLEKLRAPTVQP